MNPKLIESDVDAGRRTIMLVGEVDEDMSLFAMKSLLALDHASSKPITVYVSSYGGEVCEALAIIDVTQRLRCSVDTVAVGKCMSSGAILASCLATGWRYSHKNASWMVHAVTAGVSPGSCHDAIRSASDSTKVISEILLDLLVDSSCMPARHWRRLFEYRKDTYFDADRALEWGLIDGVL